MEPENARLKQEETSLSYDCARLIVSEQALRAIAHKTFQQGSGARGLQSVLEDMLAQAKFLAPDHPGCEVVLHERGALRFCSCLAALLLPVVRHQASALIAAAWRQTRCCIALGCSEVLSARFEQACLRCDAKVGGRDLNVWWHSCCPTAVAACMQTFCKEAVPGWFH